jgi:hypothetical protein
MGNISFSAIIALMTWPESVRFVLVCAISLTISILTFRSILLLDRKERESHQSPMPIVSSPIVIHRAPRKENEPSIQIAKVHLASVSRSIFTCTLYIRNVSNESPFVNELVCVSTAPHQVLLRGQHISEPELQRTFKLKLTKSESQSVLNGKTPYDIHMELRYQEHDFKRQVTSWYTIHYNARNDGSLGEFDQPLMKTSMAVGD